MDSQLLSIEYDFLRDLSHLVETSEHVSCLSCLTDIPDETFVFIRNEHTHQGLSLREKWSRVAFHLLAIWYMSAKRNIQVIPVLKDMFNDLGLEEGHAEVFNNYPNMLKKLTPAGRKGPNGVKIGTKSLGKGKNQILLTSKATVLLCTLYIQLGRMGRNQIWKNRCQNWWILVTMRSAVQGTINRGPPLKMIMKMKIPDMPIQ